MGLTERHWFENEEPELTDRQLEDAVSIQDRFYRRGYHKGYSDRDKEIVRCKDCQFHYAGENEVDAWDRCRLHSINTEPNNYCSWAVANRR